MKLIFLSLLATASAFRPSTVPKRHTAVKVFSSNTGEGGTSVGIQFYRDVFEPCIPNIRLTRARDGTNGVAYFTFDKPSMFENKEDIAETRQDAITAMRMVDGEGEITTSDVSASFVNGQPVSLQVQYVMSDSASWDRFMRFMDRYADSNELGFAGGGGGGSGAEAGKARSQGV